MKSYTEGHRDGSQELRAGDQHGGDKWYTVPGWLGTSVFFFFFLMILVWGYFVCFFVCFFVFLGTSGDFCLGLDYLKGLLGGKHFFSRLLVAANPGFC